MQQLLDVSAYIGNQGLCAVVKACSEPSCPLLAVLQDNNAYFCV